MKKEEARGLLMRCEAESYCPHYLQKFNCDGCKQRIALDMAIEALSVANLKEKFESADATPTVIRAKTFMRKEDFDKWAQDIKKQNKSIVCIPCDAEVVSDDAVRCKDCLYKQLMDEGDTKYYYCALEDRPNRNWSVDDTDYCSWGERGEE